jgi:hypothetical protein
MPFADKTRRKIVRLGQQARTTAGTLTWDIPKTGLLAGIYLHVFLDSGAAGWGAPHAKLAHHVISRVQLTANSGIDLVNVSGDGLDLLRYYMEDYRDSVGAGWVTALAAAGTWDLNCFIPVSINRRDPLGMFMLQNEATLLQLTITLLDPVVAGGAASTYDDFHVVPYLELYSVPSDPKDWPPLNVVHQLLEETRAVTGAGAFQYQWPRGNTYAQVIHGLDTGATTAWSDNFTAMNLTVNHSDRLIDSDPDHLNLEFRQSHGIARPAGLVAIDFLGTSGLGTFGSARDLFYSAMVTEIDTNFTMSAAGQLTTLRRQLVALKG